MSNYGKLKVSSASWGIGLFRDSRLDALLELNANFIFRKIL